MPLRRRILAKERHRSNTLDSDLSSSSECLPTTSDEAGYLPEMIPHPTRGTENGEGDTTDDELDAEGDIVTAPSQRTATPTTPSTTRETSDEEPEGSPATPTLHLHSGFVRVPLTTIKEESSGERTKARRNLPAVNPMVPASPFRLGPRSPRKFTFYDERRLTTPPPRPTSPPPKTPTFTSRIPTPRKRPARDAPEGASAVYKRTRSSPAPRELVEVKTAPGKLTSAASELWQITTLPTSPAFESPTPAPRILASRKRRAHDVPEGSDIARKRMKGTLSPQGEGEEEVVVEVKTAPSRLTSFTPLVGQAVAKPPAEPNNHLPLGAGKGAAKAAPRGLSLPAPQARHTVAKSPVKPIRPPPTKLKQAPPAKALKVPPPPQPPRPVTRRSMRGRPNGHVDPKEVDELQQ